MDGCLLQCVLEHESRCFAINHPVFYSHLGLDIADAKMVVLKTASNFQFFQRWRHHLVRVDSPGTTQSDLTAFQWKPFPGQFTPWTRSPERKKRNA